MNPEIEVSLATKDFEIDPDVSNNALRAYISTRFCQLRGEYWTLTYPRDDPKAREMIEAILNKAAIKLTADDIFNFEKALLKLYPMDVLRRRAWEIRSDFRDIAGQSQYDL